MDVFTSLIPKRPPAIPQAEVDRKVAEFREKGGQTARIPEGTGIVTAKFVRPIHRMGKDEKTLQSLIVVEDHNVVSARTEAKPRYVIDANGVDIGNLVENTFYVFPTRLSPGAAADIAEEAGKSEALNVLYRLIAPPSRVQGISGKRRSSLLPRKSPA